MKFLFLLSFFLVTIFQCQAQLIKVDYSSKNNDSIINYLSAISDKKIKKLTTNKSNEIKKIILERKKEFIKNITDSNFVFNNDVSKYLTSILKEIYQSNSNISNQDFYFFIDKSPIPNAACYGNGVFTVNLGLFNFVNSDDELAFIMCHEIAHFILEHGDKNLMKYIETKNSKETKNKINELKKQEYGKRKSYSEFMEKINYNFLKRSRADEIEADSLGYLLFSKTKFNKSSSIKALKNLQLSDEIVFNDNSKIKEHFNFENYPFNENWIVKEDVLFNIKSSSNDYLSNKDSLKTHPDMPFRIDILNKLINEKKEVKESNDKLKEIKSLISLLSISNFIDDKKIDFALYKTLTLFNKKEINENSYNLLVSSLLMKLYDLKLNHNFGKYVSPISPFSEEENLNEVKLFLQNLELKNIKKIGYQFCLKHNEDMKNNIDFEKTTQYFNNLNAKTN